MKHSRPEKKDTRSGINANLPGCHTFALGYNQAIDEYEKFLPNEGELLKIIKDTSTLVKSIDGMFREIPIFEPEKTAKAIIKRIGGG